MKVIRRPKKNNTYRNTNRISAVIGTGIVIVLAFSCVVGADSFLTDPSARTEGENYDMVTPDFYSYSENTTGDQGKNLAAEGTIQTEETTVPETTTTATEPSETTTIPETSETSAPDETVPSETTETPAPTDTPTPSPTPTRIPTPTATPMPSPTPVITEEPWEAIFYTIGEVNVRKGPGTEYEIVKTLKPGDAIETVGITSNGWYHTVRDTYVAVSMCTSEPPATPTPKPQPTKMPQASPTPTPKPKQEKKSDPTPTPKPEPEEYHDAPSKDGMTLVGTDFKITFYGPDYAGPGTDNRTTATGTTCKEGRTVAVDPSVIPTGTQIYIENDPLGGDGYYIAEDTGWGVDGHHIDIFAEDGESMNTLRGYTVYIVN